MPVRYKVPQGITSISAEGIEFPVGDDGTIEVPDGLPEAVILAIQSPHGHGLTAEPDDPTAMSNAPADVKKDTEKRLLRDLLRFYGQRVDGRSQVVWLRKKALEAIAAQESDEPEALVPVTSDQQPAAEA